MKNIAINDIYSFKFLSDPVFSPDGRHVVYSVATACATKNGYLTNLWVLDTLTKKSRQLTSNGGDRMPMWLDCDTILFVSNREKADAKDTKPKTHFYKISVSGGEATHAFTADTRVGSMKKLPDGRFLITTSRPTEEKEEEKENVAKEGKDYYKFEEVPFWMNAMGVRSRIRNMLMIFDSESGELTPVSPPFLNVSSNDITDCGKYIVYTGKEYSEIANVKGGVYMYNVENGETKTVLEPGMLEVNFLICYGDSLLMEGSLKDRNSSQTGELYIHNPRTGETTQFLNRDAGCNGSSGSDARLGGGRTHKIANDRFYFVSTNFGNSFLYSLNKEKEEIQHTNTTGAVVSFDIHGEKAIFVGQRNMELAELYELNLTTGVEQKLTNFNDDYMLQHNLSQPDYFTFTTDEGVLLEGWVIKPIGFDPSKKYPGVLSMHGGPKVAFGTNFNHEMQCIAAKGMFVFYTNPRGSDGRGDEFSTLAGDLGGKDYRDFMAFTDEVLRRYSQIDEKRLGAIGGSYGGFMANWIIGHTDRFAAVVSQRSISNYFTKALTTDIGFMHNMSQVGTTPWEDFEKMWKHSPLKYADKARTPTLFIQSEEDYRCWLSEPLQMFSILKRNGVDSKVVLFKGENHELSRAGKPKNRIARLDAMCDWLCKYLDA